VATPVTGGTERAQGPTEPPSGTQKARKGGIAHECGMRAAGGL